MTMQVGMVGTDGVLIASDTLWINEPDWVPGLSEQQYVPRYTFGSSKILVNHERGIAISCAKIMKTAEHIANRIISDLKNEELAHPCQSIERIGEKVLNDDRERPVAHCLIAIAAPSPQLYSFEFRYVSEDDKPKAVPICKKIETSIAAGDHVNAAIFWKERYYQRQPVKKLIPLAAHLVVSASKLNRGSISGLEVVLCDASGPHRLDNDSIRKLEAKANEWDEEIGALFANYTAGVKT